MAVLSSDIGDDDTGALDMGGLEVLEEVELVTRVRRDTVVANQGLGEDENLTAVRGIGHRLGVTNKGGGEDGFTRDVGVGTKGGTLENGAILYKKTSVLAKEGLLNMRVVCVRTLMVKVASAPVAAAVVRGSRAGMFLPLLPVTAALVRLRT